MDDTRMPAPSDAAKSFEPLIDEGLVRPIAVSSFQASHLLVLIADGGTAPAGFYTASFSE